MNRGDNPRVSNIADILKHDYFQFQGVSGRVWQKIFFVLPVVVVAAVVVADVVVAVVVVAVVVVVVGMIVEVKV